MSASVSRHASTMTLAIGSDGRANSTGSAVGSARLGSAVTRLLLRLPRRSRRPAYDTAGHGVCGSLVAKPRRQDSWRDEVTEAITRIEPTDVGEDRALGERQRDEGDEHECAPHDGRAVLAGREDPAAHERDADEHDEEQSPTMPSWNATSTNAFRADPCWPPRALRISENGTMSVFHAPIHPQPSMRCCWMSAPRRRQRSMRYSDSLAALSSEITWERAR